MMGERSDERSESIDLTRMECKGCTGYCGQYRHKGIDLTRMECKDFDGGYTIPRLLV